MSAKLLPFQEVLLAVFFSTSEQFFVFFCQIACACRLWNVKKTWQNSEKKPDETAKEKQELKMWKLKRRKKLDMAKIWTMGDNYCCFGFLPQVDSPGQGTARNIADCGRLHVPHGKHQMSEEHELRRRPIYFCTGSALALWRQFILVSYLTNCNVLPWPRWVLDRVGFFKNYKMRKNENKWEKMGKNEKNMEKMRKHEKTWENMKKNEKKWEKWDFEKFWGKK